MHWEIVVCLWVNVDITVVGKVEGSSPCNPAWWLNNNLPLQEEQHMTLL